MALVHCIPKVMAMAAILLGSLLLLAAGIILLIDTANGTQVFKGWSIPIAVIFILLSIVFFVTLFLYKRRIKVTGIFLSYAAKFLGQRPINFVFIPIFVALLLGLIFLCLFQYLAFSSNAEPKKEDGDIYLQLTRNTVLTVFTLI